MRGAALAAVWLVVCAQVAAGAAPLPPPTYVSECRTVWEHETNSSFVSLMNRCLAPDSQSTVPLTIVAQIQQWLQGRLYMQYCLLILLVFPFIVSTREDSMPLEVLASLSRFRFSVALLVIRVGSALALATILQLSFQQHSPYGSDFYVPIGTLFGLPNTEILVSTLVSLFLIHRVSIPAELIGAYSSLGQALLAVALGAFLHFYHDFTPLWWRAVDFVLCLSGGLVAFFVVRHFHPYVDISYSVVIWVGLLWMVYGFLYCYFVFDGEVLGAVLLRPMRRVEDQQFLRYVPISDEGAQRRLAEKLLVGALTCLLLVGLTTLRSLATAGLLH